MGKNPRTMLEEQEILFSCMAKHSFLDQAKRGQLAPGHLSLSFSLSTIHSRRMFCITVCRRSQSWPFLQNFPARAWFPPESSAAVWFLFPWACVSMFKVRRDGTVPAGGSLNPWGMQSWEQDWLAIERGPLAFCPATDTAGKPPCLCEP